MNKNSGLEICYKLIQASQYKYPPPFFTFYRKLADYILLKQERGERYIFDQMGSIG